MRLPRGLKVRVEPWQPEWWRHRPEMLRAVRRKELTEEQGGLALARGWTEVWTADVRCEGVDGYAGAGYGSRGCGGRDGHWLGLEKVEAHVWPDRLIGLRAVMAGTGAVWTGRPDEDDLGAAVQAGWDTPEDAFREGLARMPWPDGRHAACWMGPRDLIGLLLADMAGWSAELHRAERVGLVLTGRVVVPDPLAA